MLIFCEWRQLLQKLYLAHWMTLECGGLSRQTARPTQRWWQQQYAGGRWCRAAGFPGDAGSCLQVAPSARLYCRYWCDRTNGRRRLGRDSACLEVVAKKLGCPWDCDWWGWAQGHEEELWISKTGKLKPDELLWAKENRKSNPWCSEYMLLLKICLY